MAFLFRKLEVYQSSIQLARQLEDTCSRIRELGHFPLVDQIRRAAISIPINIAEGNGRYSLADRRRFFIIARGSCFELVALLELADSFGYLNCCKRMEMENKIESIAKMLSVLSQDR